MRPHGSPKLLEARRRKALELLSRGYRLSEVAAMVTASVPSVFRWKQAHERGGDAALNPKPVPGRPRKLEEGEVHRILDILLKGAIAYGFPNDLWTLKRIARVIRREFEVRYHPCHVWKVLRRAGWSCQVPERRPVQRNEGDIAHWKRHKWPAIKKKGPRTWCPPRIH